MRKSRSARSSRRQDAAAPGSAEALVEAATKLAEAERLRLGGKLDKARKICAALLNWHRDYAGAHHTMGLICADMHTYPQALSHLVQAAMQNPDNWMTLTALGGVYHRLGAGVMAARTLEQASRLKPDDAGILVTLGEVHREAREYERGAAAFRAAVAADETVAAAKYGLGLCLLELGELGEAARVFEDIVAGGGGSINLLNALSELPPALVTLDVLSLCERAVRSPDQTQASFDVALGFTRAAALDKAGRHDEAWSCLAAANASVAPSFEREWTEQAARQETVLDAARAAKVRNLEAASCDAHPISLFILGASRSGKTTAERLAGMLEGVKAGYENPIVENTVKQAFQSAGLPGSRKVSELPTGLDGLWRDIYLAELSRRAAGGRVFSNTNPDQMQNALRIASAIPNARFLLVKRDPSDLSLRIFSKKYRSGNPYAYDLEHVQAHITWYDRMIDVVAGKMPAIARVVRYEEMIADPTTALAAIRELCDLPPPSGSIPALGDDRGCSTPYRQFMNMAHGEQR